MEWRLLRCVRTTSACTPLSSRPSGVSSPNPTLPVAATPLDVASQDSAAAGSAATGAVQAQAYARLTHMLKDAVDIAPAVGGLPTATVGGKSANAQCPAAREF
jgi:hypothetical protein